MPTIDDFPETTKEPGSFEAMLERQAQRQAGKLNKPLKNVGGLSGIVAAMCGRERHSLFCQCIVCIPMELRPRFAPIPEGAEPSEEEPAAEKPREARSARKKSGNKAKKGFPVPRKKWDENRGRSSN